ncbi:MAG: T9SS type A sorting domain-containing protein [Ignavibacteria bacterium]|nr:T9SS type A sorting domain-containing protein [Ignavibacteria bacterium]
MRIFLIIFALISCISINAQQYWLPVNSPTNQKLKKGMFVDTVFGWAAGDSGVIIHTSNSGNNWVIQNSGTTETIDDIFFINQNTGWVIANGFFYDGTIILRTTNKGANWSFSRYEDTTVVYNQIYFLNTVTGFLTGYSGGILKSTNGGFNWFNTNIDTAYCPILYLFPKNNIYFINSLTGFACGGQVDIQGMIWRTTDAGLNWKTYCVSSEPLYDIKAINQNIVFTTGGDFEYGLSNVYTTNSGVSWIYEPVSQLLGKGQSIGMRTPSEFWIPLDYLDIFAVNTDSGFGPHNWREVPYPGNEGINYTFFVSPTMGWSLADSGRIYKYNSSIIGISGNNEIIPESFTIEQNYPNPFNPETKIDYTLNRSTLVRAEIFNVLGELIETIQDGYQPSGFHSVTWNAAAFPSGLYFCRITAGNSDKTIKMLLLK